MVCISVGNCETGMSTGKVNNRMRRDTAIIVANVPDTERKSALNGPFSPAAWFIDPNLELLELVYRDGSGKRRDDDDDDADAYRLEVI